MEYTVRLERLVTGGASLARLENGRALLVEGGVPGDLVRVGGEGHFAKVIEVAEPSSARVKPRCPLFGVCGGCSLQNMDYKTQVRQKSDILAEAFVRAGRPLPPVRSVYDENLAWAYRNRAQIHRNIGTQETGFLAKGCASVVPVKNCPVLCGELNEALKTGALRPPPDKDRFTVFARNGLLLIEGGKQRGAVRLEAAGRKCTLEADAGVFFQSNVSMLEKLITQVLGLAEEAVENGHTSCADLYCGVGTFGAFLAGIFQSIDLVEENCRAVDLGRKNVSPAAGKARFFALPIDKWIKKEGKAGYGFVVADPPRSGLSPAVRSWLPSAVRGTLVYVSCEASSLARDAAFLCAEGRLRLESLSFYDFYPQTAHIEALAVFAGLAPR